MQDDPQSKKQSPEPGWVFRPNAQDPNSQLVSEVSVNLSSQQAPTPIPAPAAPIVNSSSPSSPPASPVQAPQPQPTPPAPSPIPSPVATAPQPTVLPPVPPNAMPAELQQAQTPAPSLISTDAQQQTEDLEDADNPDNNYVSEAHIEWTASEYLANPKSSGWFMLLALASVIIAVVVYFVTGGDIISTVVIGVIGIALGIFAARQPQVLDYSIDNSGLHIGQRFYPYGSFKSFSVVYDNAMGYISLMPLKRFMPPLIVHYEPSDEDKIVDTLVEYLPLEEHKQDMVDSLAKRFRF